ncbi:MAG: PAS domain S-box protein [Acidobacteriia bacterium]|nr:PAS domain S-box protein [Terriglobia bacterium]
MAGKVIDIEDRRIIEETTHLLSSNVFSSSDAIVSKDWDGTILSWNQGAEEIYGYDADEMIGRSNTFLRSAKSPDDFPEFVKRLKGGRPVETCEAEWTRKDGRRITVSLTIFPIRDASGDVVGTVSIGQDITSRKQAEASIRESEAELKEAQRLAQLGSWTWSVDTDRVTWSDELYSMVGGDPRLPSPNFKEHSRLYTRESWDRLKSAVEKTLKTGEPYELELELVRPDGTLRWTSARGEARRDDSGRVTRLQGTLQDITERKRAEDRICESEANLAAAQRLAHVGSWELDMTNLEDVDQNALHWSDEVFRIFGYEPHQIRVSNETFFQAVHPDDRTRIHEAVAAALEQRKPYSIDHRIVLPSGEERVVHEQSELVCDPNSGRLLKMQGTVQDITERKRAEEALRESERRLSTLISNLPGIAYRCKNDRTWTMEFISDGCFELTGYTAEDLTQNRKLSFNDLIHPEHQGPAWTDIQGALTQRRPFQLTYRIRTAQGQTKWVWEHGRGVYSEEGELLALEGFITDITESMQTERERRIIFEISEGINQTANLDELLQRIHQTLQKAVYAENFFIALYDKKQELFEFPYFVDQFDPPPNPVKVGRSRTAYVFRTGQPIVMTERIFQGLVREGELELVGTPPAVWLGVPLRTLEETIGVLVVQHYSNPNAYSPRDLEFLTSVGNQIALAIERKRSEEEVLLQKARFQSLFENAPVGIVMLDDQDRIVRTNGAFEKLFDWSLEEIQGKFINDVVVPPDLRVEANEISRKNLEGVSVEMETLRRRRDGTRVPVHLFGVPLISKQKQIGIYAIYADLTESKQLTDQLRQAQKMEAIGRLAGGVAHDFNNLLTSIIGYSQLVLGRLGDDHPLGRNLEEVIKAGERAARLTSQLLAFSRKQILQPVILNLNTVVSDMDKMLRRLIGEDIELVTLLDPALGYVKADADQMGQIIMNLAVNSRDAMPHGGKLTIQTSNINPEDASSKTHSGIESGPCVMLTISDTGCGMDREVLSHVFEPFFTTKELGKGTGLGLSTVYGIVQQSGGWIEVFSELDVGTTFKVYLSRVFEEPQKSKGTLSQANLGAETILVVEDEEGVRSLVRSILEMKGYEVLDAGNAEVALELLAQSQHPIDMLLTDVIMPRISGVELARRFKSQYPQVKVLFMSGYTDTALTNHGVLESGTALIEKPFTPHALAQKVREVLDA